MCVITPEFTAHLRLLPPLVQAAANSACEDVQQELARTTQSLEAETKLRSSAEERSAAVEAEVQVIRALLTAKE